MTLPPGVLRREVLCSRCKLVLPGDAPQPGDRLGPTPPLMTLSELAVYLAYGLPPPPETARTARL